MHIIVDCDGVLTDGKVYYSESGHRYKSFHSRDITALRELSEEHEVIILTASTWEGIRHLQKRIPKVKIVSGQTDKAMWVDENLPDIRAIVVCDDYSDRILCGGARKVFLSADASERLKRYAEHLQLDYVIMKTRGGEGVIDELLLYSL